MADLLPPNATALERNVATVNARLGDLAAPLRDLMNPATCPAALLPWLASALSVDYWDESWTESQKRGVIAASIKVHRHKGTLAAVKAALASLEVVAEIVEWFNETPQAAPYTFRVDVDTEGAGMLAPFLASVEQQITGAKNVRSHFTVRLIAVTRPSVHIGVAVHDLVITTIYPKADE